MQSARSIDALGTSPNPSGEGKCQTTTAGLQRDRARAFDIMPDIRRPAPMSASLPALERSVATLLISTQSLETLPPLTQKVARHLIAIEAIVRNGRGRWDFATDFAPA